MLLTKSSVAGGEMRNAWTTKKNNSEQYTVYITLKEK